MTWQRGWYSGSSGLHCRFEWSWQRLRTCASGNPWRAYGESRTPRLGIENVAYFLQALVFDRRQLQYVSCIQRGRFFPPAFQKSIIHLGRAFLNAVLPASVSFVRLTLSLSRPLSAARSST